MRILHAVAMSLAVAGALASAPRTASAQVSANEANGFGEKHQLIITVDRLMPLLSYSSQSVTATQGGTTLKTTDSAVSSSFLFGREPTDVVNVHTLPRVAFDFAIINHLTLGGAFAFAFGLGGKQERQLGNNNGTSSTDSPKTTVFGFAPRVGYVLPLGHVFAFWPRVGFAFYSVSTKTENTVMGGVVQSSTQSDTFFSLDLDPQFVWAPIQHFFFHFGPLLNIPLSGSRSVEVPQGAGSVTTKSDESLFHFGISAGLGGWFDL